MVKGRVDRWLGDRGFGFLKVKGKVVFCHSGRVVVKEWLQVGDVVWVKVMRISRGRGSHGRQSRHGQRRNG